MNDVVATILALGLVYLVVKFAFGGGSSSSSSHAQRDPIPAHDQHRHHAASSPTLGSSSSSSSSSSANGKKKETLISRFNLEAKLNSWAPSAASGESSSGSATPAGTPVKGKGRAQTDDDWRKGADKRREELQRRKEEMILEARR